MKETTALPPEAHLSHRAGWLRAAVLGADDGVVSVASIMIGVAASGATRGAVVIAGAAALVAGAMSMAAGEYVSVSSQRDTEEADIALEKKELAANPRGELHELAAIYRKRGLDADLAMKVAVALSRKDRLDAHLRDELGIHEVTRARPIQAALVSAASFASLAVMPVVAMFFAPTTARIPITSGIALASLAILGAVGGRLGGASPVRAALRVLAGGGVAMLVTAAMGWLLGVSGL